MLLHQNDWIIVTREFLLRNGKLSRSRLFQVGAITKHGVVLINDDGIIISYNLTADDFVKVGVDLLKSKDGDSR